MTFNFLLQSEVYGLRKQLKYMNAYLLTCNAGGGKTKEACNRFVCYLHYFAQLQALELNCYYN